MANSPDTEIKNVEPHPNVGIVNAFDQVQFSRDQQVGRGELGAVYLGTAQYGNQNMQVVVKIPHSQAKAAEAEQEYNVLTEMRRYLSNPLPIPEVMLGLVDDLPVMVMPYYRSDELLVSQVRQLVSKDKLLEAERLAVNAALSFTDAMQALHQITPPRCCTDRKIKDLYVQDNHEIVTIDWNVLREFSPEFRVGEIRLFGHLWHELFLERKGEPPFEPFYDLRWRPLAGAEQGVISVGLRVLLARAVEFTSNNDPEYFGSLHKALSIWSELLSEDPSELNRNKIDRFLITFAAPSDINNEIDAVFSDLLWRVGQGTFEQRESALQVARQGSGDFLAYEISEEFENDPSRASEIVKARISEAEDTRDWITWAHLQRWQRLTEIAGQAGKLNADGSISSRDRTDVERRALTVGLALHRPPVDDDLNELSKVRQALSEISGFSSHMNSSELRQIETETVIREEALALNREDRLAHLLDHLDHIRNHASVDETHYLHSPSNFRDGDQILIDRILHYRILEPLVNAVNNLSLESDTAEVYRLYRTALASAAIETEGRWLERILQPIIDLVEFVDQFRDSHNSDPAHQLRESLPRAQEFLRQAAELESAGIEEWESIITEILTHVVQEATRQITGAVQSTTLESILAVQPIYNSLKKYASVLRDYNLSYDVQAIERYQHNYDFCNKWQSAIVIFQTNSSVSTIVNLIKLLDEYPQIEIPMTDLFGMELLTKHRDILQNVLTPGIEQNLQNFQDQTRNFKNTIGQQQQDIQGRVEDLQRELARYQQASRELLQQIQSDIKQLSDQENESEIYRAIHSFDINRLRQVGEHSQNKDWRESYQALMDLHNNQKLSTLLNDLKPTLKISSTTPPLETLRQVRDDLRSGMLSIDSPRVEYFFTDKYVVDLANKNRVLQSIFDLYWVAKTNQLRRMSDKPLSDILSGMSQQAQESRNQLGRLYSLFASGNNNDVRTVLDTLSGQKADISRGGQIAPSSNSGTLSDELLRHVIYSWRERLTTNEALGRQIGLLQSRCSQYTPNPDFFAAGQDISRFLADAHYLLQNCPNSVYTPHMNKSVTVMLGVINQQIEDLGTHIKESRPRGAKEKELAALIQKLNRNMKQIRSEAANKLSQHQQIFGSVAISIGN